MPCDKKDCHFLHIENPSTGSCVDKNSALAFLILGKEKKEMKDDNFLNDLKLKEKMENKEKKIMEKCMEELQEFQKLVENNLSTTTKDFKNSFQNFQMEIQEINMKINLIEDKINMIEDLILEKNNKKYQKESLGFINSHHEKMKCIQILKNEFNIVSHAEPSHKDNVIIKKALDAVEKNVQKGFLTTIDKEFILNL